MHRLVLSIELGTVQTGTGKVDPARKLKYTTAARDINVSLNSEFPDSKMSVEFWYVVQVVSSKNLLKKYFIKR